MNKTKTSNKKCCLLAIIFGMLIISFLPFSNMYLKEVQAASTASKNKKAHSLYDKKVKKLLKKSTYLTYQYVDVTGDGVHEALIEYHPGTMGSGRYFQVYTYKSGKIKRILNHTEYGLSRVSAYPKTKAIVIYLSGHGGESYQYFKYKSGKYSFVADRSRMAVAGGSAQNGPWTYYRKNNSKITKSTFTKLTKSLTVGKKKIYSLSKWKYLSNW